MKKTILIVAMSITLAGCQTVESQRINLATYSPIIDVEGEGKSHDDFNADLQSCRQIGQKAQVQYEAQRKKEQEQAAQAALLGAVLGAVAGHAIGQNNDYHSGRAATTGAIYGAAIAGGSGVDAIDYSRVIAKFGPTEVVDRCMSRRGWYILSNEGLGGG
jgi:outer membrane lipoprotein SlyB